MTKTALPARPDTPAEDVNLGLEGFPVFRITTKDGVQYLVTPIGRLAWPAREFLAFIVTDTVEGAWGDIVRCRLAIPGTSDHPGTPGVVERITNPNRGSFTLAEDVEPFKLRKLWRYARYFVTTGAEPNLASAAKRVIRNCAPAGLIPWSTLDGEVFDTCLGFRSLQEVMQPGDLDLASDLGVDIVLIGAGGVPTNSDYVYLITRAILAYDRLERGFSTPAAPDEKIAHGAPIDHSL